MDNRARYGDVVLAGEILQRGSEVLACKGEVLAGSAIPFALFIRLWLEQGQARWL